MPPLDAWLYRQQNSAGLCMTFGIVAWFHGDPPTLSELRERVRGRWSPVERLRLLPFTPGPGADDGRAVTAWPRWIPGPPALDANRHVTAVLDARPDTLEARTADLLSRPLDSAGDCPPWRLHLLPAPEGFALLLRAHHALLDGRSLVTLLRALLDGPGAHPPAPPSRAAPGGRALPLTRRELLRAAADVLPGARPLPFHMPADQRRSLSWSQLPTRTLGAARDALPSGRASANAVFLAATSAALRTTGMTGRLPWLPGVRATVPVDVRSEHEARLLGNHYATIRVTLPTAAGRPVARLAAVDGFTRKAARQRRAQGQAALVASTPRRHNAFQNALARYAESPLYSSLLCSSVRTHSGALSLGPAPMTRLSMLPALGTRHPVVVSMSIHGERTTVAVLTDHAHRDLARPFAGAIADEICLLAAAAT